MLLSVVIGIATALQTPLPERPMTRRAAVLLGGVSCALSPCALLRPAAAADGTPTTAQQNLASLSAGSRKLSDAGVDEGDLVAELLRRTEANRERNAAIVKQTTEANAFTAIDGSVRSSTALLSTETTATARACPAPPHGRCASLA